jgi:transposase-like protein
MNANHLFIWRQKVREGTLGRDRRRRTLRQPDEPTQFIELGVVGSGVATAAAAIEVELPSGVVVRLPASVGAQVLRTALMAIKAAGL